MTRLVLDVTTLCKLMGKSEKETREYLNRIQNTTMIALVNKADEIVVFLPDPDSPAVKEADYFRRRYLQEVGL